MGLIIDTGVFIRLERDSAAVDFSTYKPAYGEGFISAATCSELLVGVHLANTEQRRARRSAFVEAVFGLFRPLPFDLEVARVHAHLVSALGRGVTLGAFDLIIGATAIRYGFPVLTTNAADFRRMPGLRRGSVGIVPSLYVTRLHRFEPAKLLRRHSIAFTASLP